MTNTELLGWVTAGSYLLPTALAVAVVLWLPVKSSYLRSALAVVSGWMLSVAYTIYIYNPTGLAAGHEQGVHFPQAQYDNNTVGVTILVGWFCPLLVVALVWLVRRAFGGTRGRI